MATTSSITHDEPIPFSDREDDESLPVEIPKEVRALRTQAYDKSIADIVQMISAGEVVLDPDYQRNYVWDDKKASLLIESILLNVPIPVVYVAEDPDSKWSVVDGLQRLHSLQRYFSGDLRLKGLEILQELNGQRYADLNPTAARILRNGILRMILIFKESHPEIKYDIFMRLNRGAIRLNEQELRNCLYRGDLNKLLHTLRKNETFLRLIGLSKPHQRFADAELILRFFTLQEDFDAATGELRTYKGKMKSALNAYCERHRTLADDDIARLTALFEKTVETANAVLGPTAFQKAEGGQDGRINRAVMDLVMVGFANFPSSRLIERALVVEAALSALISSDKEFLEAITYATSDKRRVEYRLQRWHQALGEALRPQ